jgi:uncharacterized linocin/CFP29 family protein
MSLEYILNGQGSGQIANVMLATGFDPGALRPFRREKDNRSAISVIQNGKLKTMTVNAPATLRRDEWKIFDDAVQKAARPRLSAFADLRAANTRRIPNAMSKTILQYHTMGDITPATISMDGLRISEFDRPHFDVGSLPLPILHKDFQFSSRQIAESRNGTTPLDTTMAELASRRVAEEAEKLLLGLSTTYSYGGATVYGYTNFPNRHTFNDVDSPEDADWHPRKLLRTLARMKEALNNDLYYGPFVVYFSPAWDLYLDDDYFGEGANFGDITLRERLGKINGISAMRTLEFLPGFQILMVQMTSDVAQAVVGMDITTVQWESQGGFLLNFKVLAMLVPFLRSDFRGNTGIAHAVVLDEEAGVTTTTTGG